MKGIKNQPGHPLLQFHIRIPDHKTSSSHQSISFSQREYIGFRGCREFDKKRVLFSSGNKLIITGYDDPSNIYEIASWTPPDSDQIIYAGFLDETRPSLILVVTYLDSKSTLSILKIRSNNNNDMVESRTHVQQKILQRFKE